MTVPLSHRDSPLHVVLGGTGGIGAAVVAELAARGERVRTVSRTAATRPLPAGVEHVAADVGTAEGATQALTGARIAYHCAQPAYTRWPEEFPALNAAVVAGVERSGAVLVVADNLYMYGPTPGALAEGTPAAATGRKGAVRARMAADLLAAHQAGRVQVVLGRASDYFGPGGTASALGKHLFTPAVRKGRASWPLDLDQPHTVSYLPDIARGLITLGSSPAAMGRVWHLPGVTVTGRDFVAEMGAALDRTVRPTVLAAWQVRLAGLVVPFIREFAETAYQWDRPFVSDSSAYDTAFGGAPTPLPEAMAATAAWWRQEVAAS